MLAISVNKKRKEKRGWRGWEVDEQLCQTALPRMAAGAVAVAICKAFLSGVYKNLEGQEKCWEGLSDGCEGPQRCDNLING